MGSSWSWFVGQLCFFHSSHSVRLLSMSKYINMSMLSLHVKYMGSRYIWVFFNRTLFWFLLYLRKNIFFIPYQRISVLTFIKTFKTVFYCVASDYLYKEKANTHWRNGRYENCESKQMEKYVFVSKIQA